MSQQQGNRSCQSVGHDWAHTTVVKDYRRCVREDCKTVERFVNGEWIDVMVRQHSHKQHTSAQPSLFTSDGLFPGKDEERRAERAYRLILGQ